MNFWCILSPLVAFDNVALDYVVTFFFFYSYDLNVVSPKQYAQDAWTVFYTTL